MDWQRASFNMPSEATTALQNWGTELCELLCVESLTDSATQIFYKTSESNMTVARTATAATAQTAMNATEGKLSPGFVSYIKAWAETGGDRTIIPLRPLIFNGKKHFVLLVHPDVVYDWKQNSTVQQATREAMERGPSNPLFTGATYVWDNVLIHTSEFMPKAADGGGASVPWSKGVFMGAQSLCWAWGERPSIVEDSEDYEEDLFQAWRMTAKAGKPQFNSQDYGSINVYTARTNVSGLSAS
jgi:N4-gp56 family major capsid protein